MLVVGPPFHWQIAAYLIQFLTLPFPAFALSFLLRGLEWHFRLVLDMYKEFQTITSTLKRHLQTASLLLYKRTLIQNGFYPRCVLKYCHPALHYCILKIRRRWSISCSPFRHMLCPIDVLDVSLFYLAFFCFFEHGHSCRSFQVSAAGWYVY